MNTSRVGNNCYITVYCYLHLRYSHTLSAYGGDDSRYFEVCLTGSSVYVGPVSFDKANVYRYTGCSILILGKILKNIEDIEKCFTQKLHDLNGIIF